MSELRRIEPIPMPSDLVPATEFGAKPEFRWVNPTDLYVDGTYQRSLSQRSVKMIRRMYEGFRWSHIKVPNVVQSGNKLLVIDGQHTAIVAASLGVAAIPVLVVEAKKAVDQANAFVGLNTERLRVSPLDIYRAMVAAGDDLAVKVDTVCSQAGVRIRNISPTSAVAEGDTVALGTINGLVKRRGVAVARKVLDVLVKAKRAPIAPYEIMAVEAIIALSHPDIEPERLARIVRSSGSLIDARARAQKQAIPVYRLLEKEWAARIGQ